MSQPDVKLHAPSAVPATGWTVLSAWATGAHHSAAGMPCEDALATVTDGDVTVLAVSDGHGHHRHFRSGRGSELAVAVATATAVEWCRSRAGTRVPTDHEARSQLLPAVWHRWVGRVREDVAADPFSEAEQAQLRSGDDAVIAYGATLLLALVTPSWMVVAQIGDGDAVVMADGESGSPLPVDPALDGTRTTSLCQPDALSSFRVVTRDLDVRPVRAVLLATDGYGNAQTDPDWPSAAGPHLLGMIEDKGAGWVAKQLGSWVERCASASGSGDDTTVAIGLAPRARATEAKRRSSRAKRYALIATAGVLVAGAGTGLGLALTSTGGGGTQRPSPAPACCIVRDSKTEAGVTPPTLPIRSGRVTVTVPGTGKPATVQIPSAVGTAGPVAAIQEGSAVYILAGDGRLWRVPVPGGRPVLPVAASSVLDTPRPPLGYVSGAVTTAGDGGHVTYRINTETMAVTCWDVGLGTPARTQCPAGRGGRR